MVDSVDIKALANSIVKIHNEVVDLGDANKRLRTRVAELSESVQELQGKNTYLRDNVDDLKRALRDKDSLLSTSEAERLKWKKLQVEKGVFGLSTPIWLAAITSILVGVIVGYYAWLPC